jgi:phytoene desaturase
MHTVPGPTDSVVVIGAGLGGLSAALHLAGAGRHVTVLERSAIPGGRAGLIHDHGYRFDTGPTVLTMPHLVAQALAAVGEDLGDWLTLHRLDPAYRARFADGTSIDVRADPDATAEEIAVKCGQQDADGYRRFVGFLRELYRVEMPHFIDRNLDSPLQLVGTPLARLVAIGGFRRLDHKVASFFTDERLRRLFSFQAMYAGLAPAQALAIYAVITYMDSVEGVYFPEGGMHAVPRGLADAAAAHGVSFRYNTTAARIEIAGGRASAVITTHGERIPADVIVVNADLPTAYTELLPPGYTPRRVRRLRYSPSAVVLHAGSSATFPDATHHTINFGTAWDATFEQIIDRGELMSDPSFLLTTPSLTDPSLAPADRHTYYALFPTPNLDPRRGGRRPDWARERSRYRDHMIATLEARGYEGFGDGIECEHLLTPADWLAQGIAAGAPFAAAHTFGQTGPFRSSTLDRHIENLVFCGSNSQPGVGVPMVLVSGRLAAQRITGHLSR